MPAQYDPALSSGIPPEVLAAARLVTAHFREKGIDKWELYGNSESSTFSRSGPRARGACRARAARISVSKRPICACLLIMPSYNPGDPAPSGYLQWHEWAEVQHKAGLRQQECGSCGKWRYPQELSDVMRETTMRDSRGRRHAVQYAVCKQCTASEGGARMSAGPTNDVGRASVLDGAVAAHSLDAAGALFSPCRRYRYRLWRTWDESRPVIAFCMLNPSTADETKNDPTVERCERRGRMWGYGSLIVVNLFAWRATDPRDMKAAVDPVGPDNFESIVLAVKASSMFVCAWGAHGAHCGVGDMVLRRLRQFYPGRAHALKINKDGMPAHPLYLPYDLTPVPIA